MKRYDQVLVLDPYNTAARKGQEKLTTPKSRYGEEAYNETRSRQLWQVEKGWEQQSDAIGATGESTSLGIQKNLTDTARVNNKLNTIIIRGLNFATRLFARRSIFSGNKQWRTILPLKEREASIMCTSFGGDSTHAAAAARRRFSNTCRRCRCCAWHSTGWHITVGGRSGSRSTPAPPAERGSITIELNHIPLEKRCLHRKSGWVKGKN